MNRNEIMKELDQEFLACNEVLSDGLFYSILILNTLDYNQIFEKCAEK